MTSNLPESTNAVYLSLAIFAWNEEEVIAATLESLFRQSLFNELCERGLECEIICVVNGCSDRTPGIAREVFEREMTTHPDRAGFRCRVADLPERGKLNAWNQFVHGLSASEAGFLVMMDADIKFQGRDTLSNMLAVLEEDPEAHVAVDQPLKEFHGPGRWGWRRKLSQGASRMTQASPAQLCAQLYCIRSAVARNIYLPKDLAACEDGFIKAMVCTDCLTRPLNPARIRLAEGAAHSFEAYTSPGEVLKNQKRQIIGQTIVHILVDQYLATMPLRRRVNLCETLRNKEQNDPAWLKRLIDAHLGRMKHFWNLYPGLLTYRLRRLARMSKGKRLACLPAAAVGFGLTLISSFMAYRFLKRGSTDYWPKAKREKLPPATRTPSAFALKTNQQ
jgi:glycosyltransferase involved in cell wall biosynthesis